MFGWFSKKAPKYPPMPLTAEDQLIIDERERACDIWLKLHHAAEQRHSDVAAKSLAKAESKLAYERYKRADSAYEDMLIRLEQRARDIILKASSEQSP